MKGRSQESEVRRAKDKGQRTKDKGQRTKDNSLSLEILSKGVRYYRIMGNSTSRFVVGPGGRKEAVMLKVSEYRRMVRKIEDLEDALALDRAEQTSKKLIPYSSVRKRLKRAGKL